MSCCAPGIDIAAEARAIDTEELVLASRDAGNGLRQTELSVPGIHCGGCIRTIEVGLGELTGVVQARVNLSTRRVTVRWRASAKPPPIIGTLTQLGYEAHLDDAEGRTSDDGLTALIRSLAVAGFAAMNIMLMSVAVWSGADAEARDLFHWISALIALPALAYSGRVFFVSAWQALRRGYTNMDVPISIGVLLAFGLSLYETIQGGAHAYFDASISLLFFLLVGRTLDHMMRDRARAAVKGLARLTPRGAVMVERNGGRAYLPIAEVTPGMTLLVAAGERVPVNATVCEGQSDLDCSLVSGESEPQPAFRGTALQAGVLNLTAPLTVLATAAAKDSFLAEMVRMMEAAESGRSRFRRIADRAAQLYAPAVHATALLTFAGWMLWTGDLYRALSVAIAVLIITCPCALGLAVPMVQVVAARRLFECGIMIKDGGSLERLADIDTVVLDKTGTLTCGQPRLLNKGEIEPATLALGAAIAARSRHPYSRALSLAAPADSTLPQFSKIVECPGLGLEAYAGGSTYRLGRASWAIAATNTKHMAEIALTKDGAPLATFRFDEQLRPGARDAVAMLRANELHVEILSGDQNGRVNAIGAVLGIRSIAELSPSGKTAHIAAMTAAGRKVLMVGDGLNDAPALAAAHVSMAPASAADVGRNAADLVFLHDDLQAIPQALSVARDTARLIRQNLAIAIIYNVVAVPIAMLGHATPLIAAVAMSASSLIVVGNALRVRRAATIVAPTAA